MDRLDEINHYDWSEIGRRFWPLVRPHRWRGLWAAALVGAVGMAVALQPLFGVVLQDPFLFDTAIEDNLRAVQPEVGAAELLRVLDQAGAWEFIEKFPDKLQHRVGEGGSQLSGGQRQRLALARCMLARGRIVILDEATSALDPESEKIVQRGLDALAQDRTVIVIAHRLSTIRHAGRIVVMDQGRVVEQGSFGELLERNGCFARLYAIATSTSTQRIKLDDTGFV